MLFMTYTWITNGILIIYKGERRSLPPTYL